MIPYSIAMLLTGSGKWMTLTDLLRCLDGINSKQRQLLLLDVCLSGKTINLSLYENCNALLVFATQEV
jgi:hypothetical protein